MHVRMLTVLLCDQLHIHNNLKIQYESHCRKVNRGLLHVLRWDRNHLFVSMRCNVVSAVVAVAVAVVLLLVVLVLQLLLLLC